MNPDSVKQEESYMKITEESNVDPRELTDDMLEEVSGGTESPEGRGFDVALIDCGHNKTEAITAVKKILNVGLKEAKEIVDSVPTIILCGLPKEEALEIRAELERMGDITVEIRALD